ncbi:hypothetical protein AAF712_002994 [Marasmius tenuissimus]|uniref:Uncharacterized protein n=1 Tax=Marasmius tenuissimus TaxID=585030 RepID=A0ABR3A867_9AGAR
MHSFTFVATLFVLLMISSTIIFRSYILRRRYQRRLQEALAAGVILAPREQGSRRKRFRTRPKFYDVWFDTAGDTWEELMPVSVQPVKTKRRRKHTTTPVKVEPEPQPKISERVLSALSMGRHRAFRSSPGSGSTSPTAPDQEAAQTAPSPAGIEPPTTADVTSPVSPDPEKERPPPSLLNMQLQVAVLVQMPSPHRRAQQRPSDIDSNNNTNIIPVNREEDMPLPELVFGVTRLACKPETSPAPPPEVTED